MDSNYQFSNNLRRFQDSTDFSRSSGNQSFTSTKRLQVAGCSSVSSEKGFTQKSFEFCKGFNRIHKNQGVSSCERSEESSQGTYSKEMLYKGSQKSDMQSDRTSRGSTTPQPVIEKNRNSRTTDERKPLRPRTPTLPISKAPENISVEISGVSGFDAEHKLRKLCEGFHIVSLQAPCDSITGTSLGKAGLVLKSSRSCLKQLEINLLSQGLQVSEKPKQVGKKNNYSSLATVHFLDPFVSSSSKGRHHLETSENLFGSSSGVGRFHSKKRLEDPQALVLQSWDSVRRPSKPSASVKSLTTAPSYMRSTQSSMQKFRN